MKQTPLHLEGVFENIYAGFGKRLASLLLDFLIYIPIGIATLYINSLDKNNYFYTLIPNLLFGLYFYVYLPRFTGGTPGKNIVGIKIIRLDGKPIGWREAILRHLIQFLITIFSAVIMAMSISNADEQTFNNLGWLEQSAYLGSLFPLLFMLFSWINNIWVWGELIVLLTNPRKRAVHDYIANTVIVKTEYVDKINEAMYPQEIQ